MLAYSYLDQNKFGFTKKPVPQIVGTRDALADTWQGIFGFGICIVVGRTTPYGFFVQLELFVCRVTENHGTYAPVA